jgi:hypothetical protein
MRGADQNSSDQAAGTPVTPPGSLPAFQPPKPPLSREEYLMQRFHGQGAPIEGPPVYVPRTGLQKAGHIASLIAESLLNPIAAPFVVANELEIPHQRAQALAEYQRGLPAAQEHANAAAYQAYLEGESEKGKAEQEGAETEEAGARVGQIGLEAGREQQTAKANALAQITADMQSGKYSPEAATAKWQRIADANPYVGLTADDIKGAVAGTKPIGPAFEVKVGANGIPEGVTRLQATPTDPAGKFYPANAIPREAQEQWNAAAGAHQQGITEERAKEQREFSNRLLEQKLGNDYERGRMQDMLGIKNFQQLESQIMTARKAINDADARWKDLSGAVDLAQKGNSIEAQNALLKTLGLSVNGITRRINDTELDRFSSAGGVAQRLAGDLRNWKDGTVFPASVWQEVKEFADTEHKSKINQANADMDSARQTYGPALGNLDSLMRPAGGAAPAVGAPGAVDPAKAAAAVTSKTVDESIVRQYGAEHGVSYGAALKKFTGEGYKVIPKGAR